MEKAAKKLLLGCMRAVCGPSVGCSVAGCRNILSAHENHQAFVFLLVKIREREGTEKGEERG